MSSEFTVASVRPAPAIHPWIVRITHWTNAVATVVMIMSGLAIHNADPILPFMIPATLTLGGWLGGATRWHFAAMWLFAANGLLYLVHGLLSGRLRRRLLPVSLRGAIADTRAALAGRLGHDDPAVYNAVQRLLYVAVILAGVLAALSGIAIYKPVQFGWLTDLLGDFDQARIIHFLAMITIAGFLAVHVAMALRVPRTLKAMILGR